MRDFNIILAMDANKGIGKEGQLPWHLPGELRYFKQLTTKVNSSDKNNAVIMGRKTWESIPQKFRPLPLRLNIVLTRDSNYSVADSVLIFNDFNTALESLNSSENQAKIENIFVIGGAQVLLEAISHPSCTKLFLTHIIEKFKCDTFFPVFEDQFELVDKKDSCIEDSVEYYFAEYKRKTS